MTREELEKSIQMGDHRRAKQMRALMVVLPYSTGNANADNLEELYTKAPVTKMVQNEAKTKKVFEEEKKTTTPKPLTTTLKPVFKPVTEQMMPEIIYENNANQQTEQPNLLFENEAIHPYFQHPHHSHQENVKNLLASIGLTPEQPPQTTPFKPIPSNTTQVADDVKELLKSLGLWEDTQVPMQFAPIYDAAPTTALPEFSDFKPMTNLEPFIGPPVEASDFSAFKPLPREESGDTPYDHDLFEVFQQYGLVGNQKIEESKAFEEKIRKAKNTMLNDSVPELNSDLPVPANMLQTLSNMGVKTKRQPPTTTPSTTTSFPWTTSVKARVFSTPKVQNPIRRTRIRSPAKTEVKEQDYQNLHLLLDTIQKLEKLNKSLTIDDLALLDPQKFNLSDSLLAAQGPNPIDNAELDLIKNEVKRQEKPEPTRFSLNLTSDFGNDIKQETITNVTASEDNGIRTILAESEGKILNSGIVATTTDSFDDAITTAIDSTTISIIKSDDEAPASLQDSFAGGLDPVTEDPPPPVRKNGFYFLADWNSFLEVGEGKERVEVRFAPKVGDPRLFIPVTVP